MPLNTASRVSDFMKVDVKAARSHLWLSATLDPDLRDEAATYIARAIAFDRCGGAPQYFEAWSTRYNGGPEHDPILADCLTSFLGSESIGTRVKPSTQVHLDGFVAEYIWFLLVSENVLDIGDPVRIEPPGWFVADSGGDGLAVYLSGDDLIYRLWEAKSHTGEGGVRDVVNGACRQLQDHALRYLARFSRIGQSIGESELQKFYGLMPEMWMTVARGAGGGISVATASSVVEECFSGFPNYWSFTNEDQRLGFVVVIDEFSAFAVLVREELWKGL